MKYLSVLFILVSGSFSSAISVQILSQKQFQKLSQEDQLSYLKGLQRILLRMSEKSPYLAEEKINSSRMPASAPPSTADQHNYTQYLVLEEINANSPSENSSSKAPQPSVRVEPVKPKGNPATATTSSTTSPPSTVTPKPASGNAISKTTVSAPLATQGADSFGAYRDSEKSNVKSTPSPPPEIAVKASDKNDSRDGNPKRAHFRCMYAGWVVEKDPCSPPQRLPDWMSYNGMSDKNKSCLKGMAACNPVIFGLRLPKNCQKFSDCSDKAKPICISRGTDATLKCSLEAAKDDDKGTRIAAELNRATNPQLYQRYQSRFKDLCDDEQIKTNPFLDFKNGKRRSAESSRLARRDVQMTCQWAAEQIEKLNAMTAGLPSQQTPSSGETHDATDSQKSGAQQ